MWLGGPVYAQKPDQALSVTGTVIDQNGQPLPGVNIFIQESKSATGVNSDANGTFTLECSTSDVLVFQIAGYLTATHPAVEVNHSRVILTKGLIDAGDDDNVYIPFGERKKRQVSATVSTIKADDLPQIPSSSLNNVFTGRLPGLLILPNGSQQPGYDASSFLVRGRSSYNNNQDPLVLVDGVERDFKNMDLREIESVSVLKDAATIAWYGMYAANGVIYIKTKRGEATKTKVTFDAQAGVQQPINLARSLDSYTYATLYNEAQINSGLAPTYSPDALQGYKSGSDPYKYPNNNFVRDFLKKIAPTQRYVTTVTGGNSFIKYYTLLSYYYQGGIYKGGHNDSYDANTMYDRYNLRSNLDMHVSKSLDVGLDVGGRITHLRFPGAGSAGFLNTLYSTPPNAFPVLNPDGTYGGTSLFQKNNPLAMMQSTGASTDLVRNMIATINARQRLDDIVNGLSLNLFYSYDVYGSYRSGFTQDYEVYEANGSGGYNRYGNSTIANYAANAFTGNLRKNEFWGGFDYDHNFGKHGVNFSTRVSRAIYSIFGALDQRREGWSNRLSYNYNQRYFVDVIGTASGSENFMPGKRFGFFPAASAGWIISDEKFMKGASFLDFLKIRGSYGLVGNDGIYSGTYSGVRRFAFQDNYNRSTSGYNFGTSYTGVGGSGENSLANPDLTWERVYKAGIGFDAKLFKQSVDVTVDYFHETRKNILTTTLTPSIIGQSQVPVNDGEAAYKGIEASLSYSKRFGKVDFKVFGNYTYSTSKILAINEGSGLPDYQKQLGHPITSVIQYGSSSQYVRNFLKADGIFQSEAEIAAAPVQRFSRTVKPGDVKYKDINNDGVIDNLDFVTTDYNFVPKSYFGFGLNVAYKGFDLSVFFQGTKGSTISILNIVNGGTASNGYLNQFSEERWTPSTPNAEYPRLLVADRGNNTQNSDFWLRSGDYIRLKNAELGYSFSPRIIRRLGLSQLRIYASGLNLLTFDKLGKLPLDPELPDAGYYASASNASYPYPFSRIYSFGVNLKF